MLEETVTDYVSIGDYVLTGGELPSMVMIDAISRLVPGCCTMTFRQRRSRFMAICLNTLSIHVLLSGMTKGA